MTNSSRVTGRRSLVDIFLVVNEGEDFHRSAEAPLAGYEIEDIVGSTEAPPRCQRGRAT